MLVFIIWVVCAIISGSIGSSKGRAGLGWFLGLFLGPIGLLIIAVMEGDPEKVETAQLDSGEMRKCPYCAELVKREAIVCKHCGKDLPPMEGKNKENTQEQSWKCPVCGVMNKADSMKCATCMTDKP